MTSLPYHQDPPPSGRERALETLIDMDAQGSLYRAAKALDDGVPQALSSRPNLITRSALVEQAHSLGRYEIDSAAKYEAVFGRLELVKTESNANEARKERILRHYRKMMTFRDQSAPAHHGPLVETLTRLCGDSKISKQMIKTVCSHSIYASKTSYIENSDREIATLECMMANLVEQKEPDVPGMLIATLGILTGSMLEKEDNEAPKLGKGEMLTKSTSKKLDAVEDIPGLTVGSILSLLEPLEESQGPFGLDPTILDYLGTAAAAHEERIEVQKSRLQHVPLVAFTDAGDEAGTGISSAAFDRILSAVTAA